MFAEDRTTLKFTDAAAAIVVLSDGRFLLQKRDIMPGIWYPGCWGLFGGALEAGEDPAAGVIRELREELGLDLPEIRYFMRMDVDLQAAGHGVFTRVFYEVALDAERMDDIRLGEGTAATAFARDAMDDLSLVPYDAFALTLFANQHRLKHV